MSCKTIFNISHSDKLVLNLSIGAKESIGPLKKLHWLKICVTRENGLAPGGAAMHLGFESAKQYFNGTVLRL